ncbi:hypothetical protein [Nevskia ramosa]|uniref:hypothetical protein n=1 Tax=Nevskia ramosa TaxID=64002 RepID=UPI003D0F7014
MLKKKTEKQASKFVLELEKSLLDRIERVRVVGREQNYVLQVEDTLIRCIVLAVVRWEKTLNLGSNAAAGARGSKQPMASD